MATAMYFRRQAEVLLALSRATIDLSIAGRLRALAAEFRAKADELDDDVDLSPWPLGRNGSSSGDVDRH
jgi:hypothetical protein